MMIKGIEAAEPKNSAILVASPNEESCLKGNAYYYYNHSSYVWWSFILYMIDIFILIRE
jgi:hypothetical protein